MDKLTIQQRKKCMQACSRSKGTKPELLLAKVLWHAGFRYRKNDKSILGKPDLSFKRYKIAIFVDGEFWHGKDWDIRKYDIKSNREFWIKKIERNIQRDNEVNDHLSKLGWVVLRFWGKDILKDPQKILLKIQQVINEKRYSK